MQEFSSWFHPSCPIEIEYSVQVFDEIRQKSAEGMASQRKPGQGSGGLLLGTRRGLAFLRILDFEEIPCSHTAGAAFVLTAQEIEALKLRLQQRGQLAVVGFYVVSPRDAVLLESQRALYDALFPEVFQVALALRAVSTDVSRCAFYFRNSGAFVRGPEWELISPAGMQLAENIPQERPVMPRAIELPMMERAIPARANTERSPSLIHPIQVKFAGRPEESRPSQPVALAPAPELQAGVAVPAPTAAPGVPITPEVIAPIPSVGEVPVKPISVSFDSKAYKPLAPTGVRKFWMELNSAYASMRIGLSRVFYALLVLTLLAGVIYGVYVSRPMWVTPPAANLTVTDSGGLLTFHWNPDAAEFVDAGTISLLDNGRRRTIALTHKELMRGFMNYRRSSARVTASLALDDRRFIVAFSDPSVAQGAATAPNPQTAPVAKSPESVSPDPLDTQPSKPSPISPKQ